MEIEAKLRIPNRSVFRALLRLRALAGCRLAPAGHLQVADRYLDTAGGRLLAARYSCRLRTQGATVLATLKGLGGAEGAVHRRDEQEVHLPEGTPDVHAWPDGPAKALAIELTGGEPLQPLFDLSQERVLRDVFDGDRRVAQLSLDAVRAIAGRRPAFYYELEIELAPDGAEEELVAMARELEAQHGLVPEPRSKFERGLAALQGRGAAVEDRLSAEERAALATYAAGPAAELARRAAVVLAWADGLPTREIVERSGLSGGRVRFWLRTFRAQRMAAFAGGHEAAPQAAKREAAGRREPQAARPRQPRGRAGAPPEQPPAPPEPAAEPAPLPHDGDRPALPRRRPGLPTIAQFCREHGVDMAHADHVAGCALALFDALRPAHRLPRKRRRLLRQAALLCTVGAAGDPERPHRFGRDLILAQPLHNVSTADRLALACIVAFQREKARPDKEPTLAALEPKQRSQAWALAALLLVAEALDSSRTQATHFEVAERKDAGRVKLIVRGPAAEADARQAAERAGRWYEIFKQELAFQAIPPEAEQRGLAAPGRPPAAPAPAPELSTQIPAIVPDEPMSEAGRKILLLHFTRMLANEDGTRLGEDIEALHDMRVATRRMRAAYRIFAGYFDRKIAAPFNKGLRKTGRTLGVVRDLDVLLEKAEAYRSGLAAEEDASLEPLLEHWRTQREIGRWQMLDLLDGAAYRGFVASFGLFLATPGAGAVPIAAGEPVPYQVRHVVPHLVAALYQAVRAYEPVLAGENVPLTTYHMLRIDCKRLRYALEFFRDVLGPETPGLIKQVTAMQDLLGALQDCAVADGLIREFLAVSGKGKKRAAAPAPPMAGVERYLAAQGKMEQDLLAAFPDPWRDLVGPAFRRSLGLAVAAL